jgi:hypothetical protein
LEQTIRSISEPPNPATRHASESWHPRLLDREKHFFFEKKKQKTFVSGGVRHLRCKRPQEQKFFGSFFQKRTSSLSKS